MKNICLRRISFCNIPVSRNIWHSSKVEFNRNFSFFRSSYSHQLRIDSIKFKCGWLTVYAFVMNWLLCDGKQVSEMVFVVCLWTDKARLSSWDGKLRITSGRRHVIWIHTIQSLNLAMIKAIAVATVLSENSHFNWIV